LGAQTAELAALVQDRERLGRSVVRVILVVTFVLGLVLSFVIRLPGRS
jgi:hypothetical protein